MPLPSDEKLLALSGDVLKAFDAIYREHAPDAHSHGSRPEDNGFTDPFDAAGFSPIEHKVYRWERTWSADEWVGLVATFSDHQRLGPDRLATLLKEVHAAIESFGGGIEDRGAVGVVYHEPGNRRLAEGRRDT